MMGKLRLLCVGKLSEPFLRDGCAEYAKRLSRYMKLTIEEVRDQKDEIPDARALALEGDMLLARVPLGEPLVALAIDGAGYDSPAFAAQLRSWFARGPLTLVIGGSRGLAPPVYARAQDTLSFSAMTLPHGLMRLVLLEQLYRACKIDAGEKYHK